MMDYYEELGLDRSASPGEIRRAYRGIARLLHPDRCGDEKLRRLAELQMKRLNGVLGTLTSAEERTRYDRALAIGPAPRDALQAPAGRLPRWSWPWAFGVTLVVLTSLLVYLPRPRPSKPAIAELPKTAAPRTVPAAPHQVKARPDHSAKRQASKDPSPSQQAGIPLPPPVGALKLAAPPGIAWLQEQPEGPPTPAAARPKVDPRPLHPGLAGEWLFAPSSRFQGPELYPPEYIELRITEEAGVLRGRYRARYHIPDQAISPNVVFQFEGRGSEDEASLPWRGAGGAEGEITLRLVRGGVLEVTWVADRLGRDLGLISGTARLVRKLE